MKAHVSHTANAEAAWGKEAPDWIGHLAARCDAIGLKRAAAQVGYSPSTISYVLNRRYSAPTDKIALRVRATLMSERRQCPELGDLTLAQCLDWQEKAENFEPVSSQRRRMLNACRTCPFNTGKGS